MHFVSTHCIKRSFLAGAIALLLAASVAAQTGGAAGGRGLNGTNYISPTFLYSDLEDGPPDSYRGIGLRYNQAFRSNFDLIVTGSITRSDRVAGSRAKQTGLDVGVRWHTDIGSARPFVEATVGGTWWDYAGFSDNSFTYAAGVGAEFQVTGPLSIAPMLGYSDAPDFPGSGDAFVVVRTNYWINSRWSVRVNFSVSEDSRGLGAGVAYAF